MDLKAIENNGFSSICTKCRIPHLLGTGNSRKHCKKLMIQLDASKTLVAQTSTAALKKNSVRIVYLDLREEKCLE